MNRSAAIVGDQPDAETYWAEFHRLGRWLRYGDWPADGPHRLLDLQAWAIAQIRRRGYVQREGQRVITYLDVNDVRYWTQGTDDGTLTIQHHDIPRREAPYDAIADAYDTLFQDTASLAENDAVLAACGPLHHRDVFDIGCGTGLACGYLTPPRYLGIDPAQRMLERLRMHYPAARTVCARLRAFVADTTDPPRFDVVLALFGVGSYLTNHELSRIPTLLRPGGRAHVMFYAPGYVPVTYQQTGHYMPYRVWAPGRMPGTPVPIGNHVLVTLEA